MYVTFAGDLDTYLYPHLTDLLRFVANVGVEVLGGLPRD